MRGDLLGPNRRNGIAIAAAAMVLSTAYGVIPSPSTKYAAWLIVFWIWMAWFVVTAVIWVARAEF